MIRPLVLAGSLGDGGSERQLYLWCRHLRDQVEATVVGFEPDGVYVDSLRELGVTVELLASHRNPTRRVAQLLNIARRVRPTLIQSQHAFVNPYAAVVAKAMRVSSIGALRTDVAFVAEGLGRWTRPALRWPDVLLGNSRRTLGQAIEWGASASACQYLPNMVEPRPRMQRGATPSRARRVGFVGRLVEPKRPLLALEAFELIGAWNPDVEFVIIGDGPMRPQMRGLVDHSEIAGRTRFLGQLHDVGPELDALDVILVSSRIEGTPNVVLEALQAGTAVVSTDVGDVAALLAQGRGVVCASDHASELATAVHELINDPDRLVHMRGLAQAYVDREHGVDTVGAQLLSLYKKLSTKGAFRS